MGKDNLDEELMVEDESLSDLHTNSVYRTLRILESLSYNMGRTLEELAPITGLARPTLYRFLTILTRMGYVSKNKDNRYRLTPRLFTVAAHSIDDVELSRIVKPFMEDLSFETGETTILGIRDDDEMLHIPQGDVGGAFHIAGDIQRREVAMRAGNGIFQMRLVPGDGGKMRIAAQLRRDQRRMAVPEPFDADDQG